MAINKIQFGGQTLIDLTGDTVTAADLASGVTAHDRTGTQITGTGGGGGGAIVVVDETLPNGSTAKHITGVDISDTTATASDVASGKVFYTADGTQTTGTATGVTVESLSVTQNGTYTAPTGKAYSPVTVNVSGGGGGEAEEKDVNFYDYDGTRVYSYTKADFLALSAMPSNPDHSGDDIPLTSQGWNWTLSDAKTYVTTYGMLDVGQMYVTTDEKTHIVMEIPEKVPDAQLTFYVRCTPTIATGVTIDWDDGNTTTTSSASAATYSHTYAAPGVYDITLNATSGTVSFVGISGIAIYGSTTNNWNRGRIKEVRVGKNVTAIGGYAFRYCYALETVTIPSGVLCNNTYMFDSCVALKAFTFPTGTTTIGDYAFQYCYVARQIISSSSVTSIGTYAFSGCYSLQTFSTPSSVTSISANTFYNGLSLRNAIIPNGVTSIGGSAFRACYALEAVTIPSGVTSLGASAFEACYSVAYIRFLPTTPPSRSSNTFTNVAVAVKFVVPDNSVTAYKGASNWSADASQIIGESDWDPA